MGTPDWMDEAHMALDDTQAKEVEAARGETFATARLSIPELEQVLFRPLPVLDHGFVRVVDYMGGDAAVVQAARVSYGRGTRQVQEDRGLIMYLMRHWHSTPFEMAEIKLHVKLPIFVARQWIRHRTASVNEYSGRYSILDSDFYVPSPENMAGQSASNRQGRDAAVGPEEAARILDLLRADAQRNYASYRWMLNEDDAGASLDPERTGLARELARIGLGLNTYTQWYWKTNLHNLLNFLRLRADPHAQYEIRAYADVIMGVLQLWAPVTHDAFVEHRLGAATLSRTALSAVRRILKGERVDEASSGLTAREWRELEQLLGLPSVTP